MNKYESIIILSAKIAETEIDNIIQKIKEIIELNGKITEIQKLGLKKLAYEVRGNKEGYYVLFNFESDENVVAELERYYRIAEEIIKFITIKKDD